MDATTVQRDAPRYEAKFTFPVRAFDTLVFLLRSHGAGLHTPYPPRTVQSIYFDTAECRAIQENIVGQASRRKLRFRWYGPAADEVRGALELKRRENVLVYKQRAVFAEPVRIRGQSRPALLRALRRQTPASWRPLLDEGLEASQWIQYERHYFATRDGTVRVTVDRRLKAWDLRQQYLVRDLAPTPLPGTVIVECKARPEHYDALQDVAGTLPSPRSRCSKYVMASLPGQYRA